MRIDAHTPTYVSRPAAGAATSAPPSSAVPEASAGRIEQTDFTSMTRRELFDWMNGKIRGGELSLDDSSGLLGMSMSMPVAGGAGLPDNTQKLDFAALAGKGLSAALGRGDKDGATALRTALSVMNAYQGRVSGVDISV